MYFFNKSIVEITTPVGVIILKVYKYLPAPLLITLRQDSGRESKAFCLFFSYLYFILFSNFDIFSGDVILTLCHPVFNGGTM